MYSQKIYSGSLAIANIEFNESRVQGEIIQQLECLVMAVFGAGCLVYVDSSGLPNVYFPARC